MAAQYLNTTSDPSQAGQNNTVDVNYYSGNLPPTHLGKYQFLNLTEIINNFTATYVGEGKILAGVLKADINFHAHRALAELHYDTFRSCKSQEITLPPSLTMKLPHDYVNYTKVTWSDANGIERVIYPTGKTSNPQTIQQNNDGEYLFSDNGTNIVLSQDHVSVEVGTGNGVTIPASFAGTFEAKGIGEGYDLMSGVSIKPDESSKSSIKVGMEVYASFLPPGTTVASVTFTEDVGAGTTSDIEFTLSNTTTNNYTLSNQKMMFVDNTGDTTWGKYKGSGNNQVAIDQATTNPAIDVDNYFQNTGQRYGLDGQYAQANGSFFIDCNSGKIHFSSNLSGKTIILHYLSDGLGLEEEMLVPKLAEEAIYKWIAYGCLSARAGVPEYVIARYKKEKYAETRKAKLRLSNIKIEEITQIIRGKNKWIKH